MAYKKMRELKPMAGLLETITAMDFRRQPGEILDSVALGKTFVITKQGKPVAVLSRPPGEQLTITIDKAGRHDYSL